MDGSMGVRKRKRKVRTTAVCTSAGSATEPITKQAVVAREEMVGAERAVLIRSAIIVVRHGEACILTE